jgi:hypothetical protein
MLSANLPGMAGYIGAPTAEVTLRALPQICQGFGWSSVRGGAKSHPRNLCHRFVSEPVFVLFSVHFDAPFWRF